MIKAFLLTISATFCLISSVSLASPKYRMLKSAEGVQIVLAYDVITVPVYSNKPSSTTYATPFAVTVRFPFLTNRSNIRVVLVNTGIMGGSCGQPNARAQEVFAMDLKPLNNGDFQAEFYQDAVPQIGGRGVMMDPDQKPGLKIAVNGYCFTTSYQLEVAVVVDGRWLKDPVNGTSNFQVNL